MHTIDINIIGRVHIVVEDTQVMQELELLHS